MAEWKYTDRHLRGYLVGSGTVGTWDAVAVAELRGNCAKIASTLKQYYRWEEDAIEKGRDGVLSVGDLEELEMLIDDFEYLAENIGLGTPEDEGIDVGSWIEYFGDHAERLYDIADTYVVDKNDYEINKRFMFIAL